MFKGDVEEYLADKCTIISRDCHGWLAERINDVLGTSWRFLIFNIFDAVKK